MKLSSYIREIKLVIALFSMCEMKFRCQFVHVIVKRFHLLSVSVEYNERDIQVTRISNDLVSVPFFLLKIKLCSICTSTCEQGCRQRGTHCQTIWLSITRNSSDLVFLPIIG